MLCVCVCVCVCVYSLKASNVFHFQSSLNTIIRFYIFLYKPLYNEYIIYNSMIFVNMNSLPLFLQLRFYSYLKVLVVSYFPQQPLYFYHFHMKTLSLYYKYYKILFILIRLQIIAIYIYCIISIIFVYIFLFFANKMQTMFTFNL